MTTRQTIQSPDAPAAIGPYSQAIRAGQTLYLSGQIGLDPATMTIVEGGSRRRRTRCSATCARSTAAAGGSAGRHGEGVDPDDGPRRLRQGQRHHGDATSASPIRRARHIRSPRLPRGALIEVEGTRRAAGRAAASPQPAGAKRSTRRRGSSSPSARRAHTLAARNRGGKAPARLSPTSSRASASRATPMSSSIFRCATKTTRGSSPLPPLRRGLSGADGRRRRATRTSSIGRGASSSA